MRNWGQPLVGPRQQRNIRLPGPNGECNLIGRTTQTELLMSGIMHESVQRGVQVSRKYTLSYSVGHSLLFWLFKLAIKYP